MTMTELRKPADVISTEMILRLFEIQSEVLLNLFNIVLNEAVSMATMVTPLFTRGSRGGFNDDVSLTLFCMGGTIPLLNFVDILFCAMISFHDFKFLYPLDILHQRIGVLRPQGTLFLKPPSRSVPNFLKKSVKTEILFGCRRLASHYHFMKFVWL